MKTKAGRHGPSAPIGQGKSQGQSTITKPERLAGPICPGPFATVIDMFQQRRSRALRDHLPVAEPTVTVERVGMIHAGEVGGEHNFFSIGQEPPPGDAVGERDESETRRIQNGRAAGRSHHRLSLPVEPNDGAAPLWRKHQPIKTGLQFNLHE